MAIDNNESLVFKEEDLPAHNVEQKGWKLLIVDDEEEVHIVTKMVLSDFSFEENKLFFLDAFSGEEAKKILSEHHDIAIVLLDVVMEKDDAGLDVVRWIRSELKNLLVRIILRTGQPGAAPERKVIVDYEINDYKAKTELTSIKLFTTIMTAIRAYRDLKTIKRSKEGFHKIISASSELFSSTRALNHFIEGVLTQLTSLLRFEEESLYLHCDSLALKNSANEFQIIAGTGDLKGLTGSKLIEMNDTDLKKTILESIEKKTSLFHDNYYIGFFPQREGGDHILVLKTTDLIKNVDQEIIQVFSTNVSIALDNVNLNQKIESTQREIIFILGEVVESRSKETSNHVRRVAAYSYLLAKKDGMSENEAQLLRLASPMHDVGKIGISDSILNKPGPLTSEERAEMCKHTTIGYEILHSGGSGLLQIAAVIARGHHERWDGQGYPDGIAGESIPLVCRITSIADVFDALSHKRSYKQAWTLDDTFQFIIDNKGTMFDPHLADLFQVIKTDVKEIFERYGD